MNKKANPFFGWILKDNPNFWEDNGYKPIALSNFHYYGCNIAKENHLKVYRKQLYINYDMEEESMIELFPCGVASTNHSYMVAIYEWNNAGDTGCPLKIVKQVLTIDEFNQLIMEYIGDNLEGGSYILKQE